MEKIASFLTNNIIMIWVAPIVTGLIVAIIVKVLSINKSKKEIKRANLEYKNAILPYVLQKIYLGETVLHAIRDAISKETGILKKHLYSDQELMNMLIFDITKTQFSTENGKKELIDHICNMFSFDKDKDEEIERGKEKKSNNLMAILSTCIGMFCIICILFIYSKDPQALNDANEAASIITAFLLIFSVMSFFITFMHMPVIFDFYDKGIFGIINELEESIIDSINSILFGRLRHKNNNEEKNSDEERNSNT